MTHGQHRPGYYRDYRKQHPDERRGDRHADRGSVGYRSEHFVAIDGEGLTHHRSWCRITPGQSTVAPIRDTTCACPQSYVYLAAWDGREGAEPMELHNPDWAGLSTLQVFGFLMKIAEHYSPAKFVVFGLGYDLQMWLRDFGPPDVWRIRRAKRSVWSRTGEWRVHYLPKRNAVVQSGSWQVVDGHRRFKPGASISIDDLHTFFNTRFEKVVRDWFREDPTFRADYETIARGKAGRRFFTVADYESGEVQRYNKVELKLTKPVDWESSDKLCYPPRRHKVPGTRSVPGHAGEMRR